jgi:hypothetical protein
VATDISALTEQYLNGSPALAAAQSQAQTDIASGLIQSLGSVAGIDPSIPATWASALLGDFNIHAGLVNDGTPLDATYHANVASGMDTGAAVRAAIYTALHFPG